MAPGPLARAISEIGRIAKTLHLLAYIDDEAYRRRILQQINRGEGRHSVARAVFFGKRAELIFLPLFVARPTALQRTGCRRLSAFRSGSRPASVSRERDRIR